MHTGDDALLLPLQTGEHTAITTADCGTHLHCTGLGARGDV